MPADSDSPGNSYSTLKNRSFRSEGPKGRNSKERCPVLATRSQGRPARPDLLICFIIFRATPLGRVALTCLRPLRARRGQPLLRGRAVCAENWESGFLPEIRGVPSPPFSPLPVPRRRGPRGWGRRHVYPAASHGSGLTHRAKRRCPHRSRANFGLPCSTQEQGRCSGAGFRGHRSRCTADRLCKRR